MAKGNFIEYVVSDNPNKYPNDGEQSGYYYELYGKPKTLISFTIDGTSYQAEEGMTWREWISSKYNTNHFTIEEGDCRTIRENEAYCWVDAKIDDKIIENKTYLSYGD